MRAIDADALVAEQCGQCDGACEIFDEEKCLSCKADCHCDLREAIDNAPTLDLAPKWISVDEEYPEDLKLVLLAYADNGYVDIGYYDESFAEWDDLSDSKILRPTHWMPLPEVPKEES
jgi:hypothetical protein